MFGVLFNGALLSLVLPGRFSFEAAVPQAHQMALWAMEYLRRCGVDVDAGAHVTEAGALPPAYVAAMQHAQAQAQAQAQAAAQAQAQVQTPAQPPLQKLPANVPSNAVQVQVPVPAPTPTSTPTPTPTPSANGAPTVVYQTEGALVDFLKTNLRAGSWVAGEDMQSAQAFMDELRARFGVTTKG